VRSIVRDKWQEAKAPEAYHIKKLRREIAEALKDNNEKKTQQSLIAELEKIKEGLLSVQER